MVAYTAHLRNESTRRPTALKPISLFVCIASLLSCSTLPFWGERRPDIPEWLRGDLPKKVAILPFENVTQDPELQDLVRRSFYSHFSLKNYSDLELKEVDRALQILLSKSSTPWKELSPQALGELFQADFLIYGKVIEYSRFYAGIYSQVSLKVQVEMVESRSGNGVWWKAAGKRSHEGGIPFSIFGLIPEAVRSGLHMSRERTLDLVERLSREIVADIPDPPLADSSPYFLDVQVGSFLDTELAMKARDEVTGKGHQARVESVQVGDRTYHRVLIGPFREAAEAEAVRSFLSEKGFKPILIHHRPERK
jgi:TolB-like protein